MLVLARKIGQKVRIGDSVCVEIVKVHGNRVTVGITAPADIRVLRAELNPGDAPSESPPAA